MTSNLTRFGALIALRDGWKCHYCGAPLLPTEGGKVASVDHVKPKSKGGATNVKNLRLACWDCNQAKGDRDVKTK